MKASTKTAICIALAALMPLHSLAQRLSAGTATPAASTAKAGDIVCTYRIGMLGLAKVSRQPGKKGLVLEEQEADGYRPEPPAAAEAYPNPFADEIRVTFPAKENAGCPAIQIIDMAGKVSGASFSYSPAGPRKGMASIKASGLPSGKYIIRILTGGCVFSVNAIKI